MIEVKNLYKSFDGIEVLKDISTVFEDGKTNLIIGQSGSGKTVLMKNLVGLFDPTAGQILYDGRDFVRMSKEEKVFMRREMGMIFQSAALFDSMTVLENVMFPLDMFSNKNLRERQKRAMDCLDRVNLVGAEGKYPGEISGGMQKRVAIARAIALNPKYLFCDEPNSGLDPKTSLVIDDLLHSITQEFDMTTIINTHDMNSVMGIGENIIFIYEGRKEWQGVYIHSHLNNVDIPASVILYQWECLVVEDIHFSLNFFQRIVGSVSAVAARVVLDPLVCHFRWAVEEKYKLYIHKIAKGVCLSHMTGQTVQDDDILRLHIPLFDKCFQKFLCNREILILKKLVGLKKPFYSSLLLRCKDCCIILNCIPQLLAEIKVMVGVPPQLLSLHLVTERSLSCPCGA